LFGFGDITAEAALIAVAARVWAAERPLVLARPRRGSVDLGDRDTTPGARPQPDETPAPAPSARERWLLGAVCTAALVTVGVAVRGALAIV
jgi:hypothetical protein